MENSSPAPIQFALFAYKLQSGTEVVKHHHACFLWPMRSCCPQVIWLHKIACNSISEQKPKPSVSRCTPISRFLSNQNQLWHRLTSLSARIKITWKIVCVTIIWWHPPQHYYISCSLHHPSKGFAVSVLLPLEQVTGGNVASYQHFSSYSTMKKAH